METRLSDEREALLRDLLDLRKENLKGLRSHRYQMLLLSGAIAAFLMPVYTSSLPGIQRVLIPSAIILFLLIIAFGTLHMSFLLRDENSWLADMQCALEDDDQESYLRALKRSQASTKRKLTAWFYSILLDGLFAAGCLFLVAAIVLRQFDR